MSYAHSHPNSATFVVRELEAEAKVPSSRTEDYEPPTRASLCDCATPWWTVRRSCLLASSREKLRLGCPEPVRRLLRITRCQTRASQWLPKRGE
jgi:hypothetical protein